MDSKGLADQARKALNSRGTSDASGEDRLERTSHSRSERKDKLSEEQKEKERKQRLQEMSSVGLLRTVVK